MEHWRGHLIAISNDAGSRHRQKRRSTPAAVAIRAPDLAAILYTSGSTGQPKGVALCHSAVAAFTEWAAEVVTLGPSDRIASTAPFSFDLYAVLGQGASLHFVPAPLCLAPAQLSAWLRERAISGWYTVPSLLTLEPPLTLGEARNALAQRLLNGKVDYLRVRELLEEA